MLSLALIVLLGYFAIQIIAIQVSYWSLLLGIGVFSMGVFIFIFLVKFIFTKDKTDHSLLIEINRKHEPKLFELIDEVVENVGTQKPKKVLLSPEVNASVSYNSVFWSMILPVKKNLTIGLGLINSTTESELKAILAHEFGHFSQRSMKVGSYVNQANKMVFNTLYKNENFDSTLNSFAKMHALITLFAQFSYFIISGIKWILQRTHNFLYKKHMSLSRQMEFNADAIAATVVGSEVNCEALLRLDLSEMALNNSVNFYLNSPEKCITKNIYENQNSLMTIYAKEFNYKIENELPKVTLSDIYKFNHSKLHIEDQWASHPTMQQRVESIMKLNIPSENLHNNLAKKTLNHFDKYSEALTQKYLAANRINYNNKFISNDEFLEKFETTASSFKFPEIFNSYFNLKNPPLISIEDIKLNNDEPSSTDFFNDENVNKVFEISTIASELQTLEVIKNKDYKIKTFDYDGQKYFAKDAHKVQKNCEKRLEILKFEIEKNDQDFLQFLSRNIKNERKNDFEKFLEKYIKADSHYENYMQGFQKFVPFIDFMRTTLPFEQIRKKRFELAKPEEEFKQLVKNLIAEDDFNSQIKEENLKLLQEYLVSNNKYFEFNKYINSETTMLFEVLDVFFEILSNQFLEAKKNLLVFEAEIYAEILKEKIHSTVLSEFSNN